MELPGQEALGALASKPEAETLMEHVPKHERRLTGRRSWGGIPHA